MNESTTDEFDYQISDLPFAPRIAYRCLLLWIGLLLVGRVVLKLLTNFNVIADPSKTVWFKWLLVAINSPLVVALILGYITIIRYPNLSCAMQVRQPLIGSPRAPIWKSLGYICMLLGFMGVCSAPIDYKTIRDALPLVFVGLTIGFNGYLMAYYDRTKNVVIATFLDITFWLGFILAPLYFPALILGARNYKRILKNRNGETA